MADAKGSMDTRIDALKAQLDQLTQEHGRLTQFEAEMIRLMREFYKKTPGSPMCGSVSLAEELQKEKPVLTANHARAIWERLLHLEGVRVDAESLFKTYSDYRAALEVLLEKSPPVPKGLLGLP